MHYPEGSDSTDLWAGLKAWVAVLDGLTMALSTGEVNSMGALTSGVFAASTALTSRMCNEILQCTKKVLWASYQSS